jgi:hypothetical protein
VSQLLQLRLQAEGGDPRAQLQLARMLLLGEGAPYAPGDALRLVTDACAKKDEQALLFHAALAVLGLGRQQSFSDAIDLVAQAAKGGSGRAKGQLAALGGVDGFDIEAWRAIPPMQQHHQAPRVFTIESFLPKPVCAWFISQTRKRLEAARVKDPRHGVAAANAVRTNTGAGFSTIEPDIVLHLARMRVAAAIGVPLIHQEPTNVLHYDPGQEYSPHFDFITAEDEYAFAREIAAFGQRICTFLIYLNEGYEGGETEFPRLDWRYKGRTGDALVFWNVSAKGERERNSLHAGLPVLKGEKWLYSQWVRERPVPLV